MKTKIENETLRDSLAAHAALLSELVSGYSQPALRAAGLSPAVFDLLGAVRASGGRATQVELARRLGVKPPSLSETAQLAIQGGFLESIPYEQDRRAKLLRLTTKGKQVLQKIMREVANAELACLEGIEADALGTAIEVLRRASMNLARLQQ